MSEPSGDMTAAFSDALSAAPAATASPAVTPTIESPAAETSAPAATTQAAAETETPVPATTTAPETPPAGEPPKWRWQDILANARDTAAKEAEARIRQEVEQQYTGLKDFAQIDASERAGLLVWQRALSGDPQALARIKANPDAVQAIQRLFVAEQQAQDTEPEPDLQAPDGTLVYSAAKQREWRECNNRQLEKKFSEQLQPLQRMSQTFEQRERQDAYNNTTASAVARLTASEPDFKEHKRDVWELINSDRVLSKMAIGDPARPDIEPDPATAIEIAWGRVYRTKVLPAKQKTSEADVVANLQQRAVAGTVNPSAATSSTPKKFTGFGEALQHFSTTGR
jgi:hypothetical protein